MHDRSRCGCARAQPLRNMSPHSIPRREKSSVPQAIPQPAERCGNHPFPQVPQVGPQLGSAAGSAVRNTGYRPVVATVVVVQQFEQTSTSRANNNLMLFCAIRVAKTRLRHRLASRGMRRHLQGISKRIAPQHAIASSLDQSACLVQSEHHTLAFRE